MSEEAEHGLGGRVTQSWIRSHLLDIVCAWTTSHSDNSIIHLRAGAT